MEFKYPKYYETLTTNEQKEWDYFKKIIIEIQKRYLLQNSSNPIISNFHLFESKQKPKFFNSWQILKGKSYFVLCLIEYEIQFEEAHVYGGLTRTQKHKYFFGYTTVKNDFGKTLIRPETLSDKITELFIPLEIDIKGFNKFNSKYFVLSNNKDKFLSSINSNTIDYIAKVNGLQLEFDGQRCLFRLEKSINLNETIKLCEIGLKLNELLKSNNP